MNVFEWRVSLRFACACAGAMAIVGWLTAASAQQSAPDSGSTSSATAPATAPSTQPETQPATQPALVAATQPSTTVAAASQPTTAPQAEPAAVSSAAAATAPDQAALTPTSAPVATTEPAHAKEVPAPSEPPVNDAPIPAETSKPAPEIVKAPFVRITEQKNKYIALEIASRDFVRPDGAGPKVGLVAVAHIADQSFYQAVQKLLDTYDVVLYESVKPAGTGGAGGATDAARIASTKSAMEFVGGLIEAYHSRKNEYPADINAVVDLAGKEDARLREWLEIAMIDAWGHKLVYQLKPEQLGYELTSLGGDGAIGGEGINADIALGDHPPDPFQLSKEDNLQVQLANALGLKFQLASLSYGKTNWRCSDMAIDAVSRALGERGIDFGPLGGTLAGSSFPAKVVSFLLNLMKIADSFMEGQISDTFKVLMIQMLGDPAIMERGLDQQMGEGFTEVIVMMRNQCALADFKKIAADEQQIKSVAILYGAAHMPDMVSNLMTMGYRQVEGPEGEHWLTAIKVDFTKSAVSPQDVAQIRMMMKQMMRR